MHNDVQNNLLQIPKETKKQISSPPLVGKRARQSGNSLDDQQWNDFINNVNEIDSDSPHDTTAKLTPPKNSLLDTIMKRQRVNSAATKTEFSFMPSSFKATKTNSAPTATNSPIFAPSMPSNRRRDQKATLKQFNLGPSTARSPLLQPQPENMTSLPKVVIRVPDLNNPTKIPAQQPCTKIPHVDENCSMNPAKSS